jgi:hypothetical protein
MRSAWAYLIGVVLLVGLASLPSVTAGLASNVNGKTSAGLDITELKEQLKFGLRARTRHDFEFIDRVVAKVRSKALSMEMVESTFLWARRKQPYPFPYFERALRIRAAEAGIDI